MIGYKTRNAAAAARPPGNHRPPVYLPDGSHAVWADGAGNGELRFPDGRKISLDDLKTVAECFGPSFVRGLGL